MCNPASRPEHYLRDFSQGICPERVQRRPHSSLGWLTLAEFEQRIYLQPIENQQLTSGMRSGEVSFRAARFRVRGGYNRETFISVIYLIDAPIKELQVL